MRKSLSIVLTGDFLSRGLLAAVSFILIGHMEVPEFADYVVLAGFASLVSGALTGAFGTLFIVNHDALGLKARISEFFVLQLFGAAAVVLVAVPMAEIFDGHIWLMSMMVISSVAADFARDVERQKLNFVSFALYSLVRNGIFLSFVLFLVFSSKHALSAANVASAQIFAACIATLPLLATVRFKIDLKSLTEILSVLFKKQLLFFLYVLFVAVLSQIDILLLRLWSSEHEVAVFGSAFRYYAVMIAGLGSINTVLLPHLPAAGSNGEMQRIMKRVSKITFMALPLLALAALLSPWVLPMIDKGKFPEAIHCFQVLCASAAISLMLSPYGNVLLVQRMYRHLFVGVFFGLLANAMLNYLLIPHYGALGSAISILCVGATLNMIYFLIARRVMVDR